MVTKPRVVIRGGGFGGLESIFYLKYKLRDQADLTLVSDQPKFLFKPNMIYIPFGSHPEKLEVDLTRPLEKQSIGFINATVQDIAPGSHSVATSGGTVAFDYLVVATGARMRSEEIPGLYEHAITAWTPDDMLRLRDRIDWAKERAAGNSRARFLFLIPPNNKCSGPLYELVMMLYSHLRQGCTRACIDLVFATKEAAFIEAFGPRLNTVVSDEIAARKIEGHTGYIAATVEPNKIIFQNGQELAYDILVSFPPYVASSKFSQLPTDIRGVIQVEHESRRIVGHDRMFAVGDVTDFPIKQAFLALLQGDAAGDCIAAEVLGEKPALNFKPLSMCVMEQFNKATFAQVPPKYSSDPNMPVVVDTDDTDHYEVGVSPLWRMGKTVLGLYLPWCFGHGKPFHTGIAWDAMDFGLKMMVKVLAT